MDQARVHHCFDHNNETGELLWKNPPGSKMNRGQTAGCRDKTGYIRIQVDGKRYLAHRLVWLYYQGYLSENQIDHINRNTSDNRINNLREVSQTCNLRNTGNRMNNTSGVKGVYWIPKRNYWIARVKIQNIGFHLGCYKDFDEAVCHRLAAEQCLNWETCDSSSPAYKYVQDMIK